MARSSTGWSTLRKRSIRGRGNARFRAVSQEASSDMLTNFTSHGFEAERDPRGQSLISPG